LRDDQTFHGTAVMIDGQGVLLVGKPGSGKSDLALRLVDRGAQLIGDDIVKIVAGKTRPAIHAPERIAGKLEVRNLGILEFEHIVSASLYLCVQLDGEPERLPQFGLAEEYVKFRVPKIVINAFEASAPIKVELALRELARHGVNNAEH
jgi:HPr kinase/phosphorylase